MGTLKVEKDIKELLNKFPKLAYTRTISNRFTVSGEIDIFDGNESYWDSFIIKLIIPQNYPYGFPQLYEISNKIPRQADWHISSDGSCCVTILHEALIRAQKGITLNEFMIEYAIPFFANQIYFKQSNNQEWANGDYKHEESGLLQYYIETLKVKDIDEAIFILKHFSDFNSLKRNEKCLCLNNKKFKHCHYPIIKHLSMVKSEQREFDLIAFTTLREKTI